ncbi:MlaD family protein [Nocardia spumae]|uniref:MlaD family protein n=1 Tax=Nocardia spumae TaxID=2887190 RepID=UPI001D134B6A|nr:MlaD family protein [Nocardia spumae]
MPNYGLPGVAINRRRSLIVGVAALVTVLVAVSGWRIAAATHEDSGLRVRLHTQRIGDGIVAGTQVRADGVLVGSVTDIVPAALGTQTITLELDRSRLDGLDDSLRVDYAAANLFGISEIDLIAGPGGAPLHDDTVVDLTGPREADAYDATMGALLRSVSQVSGQVLTPKFAQVLTQIAGDAKAFTPLLEAMVSTARTFADHQHMPVSDLFGRYGTALTGVAPFAGTVIGVIDQIHRIEPLRTDRARFDATVDMVVQQLFPTLQNTMFHAQGNFFAYTAMLTPLLAGMARMVPAPEQSSHDLRTLIDRLRAAMPETPDGPVLNLDLDLRGVPGLAVPLLGQGGKP